MAPQVNEGVSSNLYSGRASPDDVRAARGQQSTHGVDNSHRHNQMFYNPQFNVIQEEDNTSVS